MKTGEELRDRGIKKAVNHADQLTEKWSEKAYEKLKLFLSHEINQIQNFEFMTEQFREFCEVTFLDDPPSLRAFGGIMAKAAKVGLIERVGYANVTNPKAHATPAAIWRRV